MVENIITALNEIERETDSIDALFSYLDDPSLPVTIHIKRAFRLLSLCLDSASPSGNDSFPPGLKALLSLPDEAVESLSQIWKNVISNHAYDEDPEDNSILLGHAEVAELNSILRRAVLLLRRRHSPKTSFVARVVRSPAGLLLMALPLLAYAALSFYTRHLNPTSWFASGFENIVIQSVELDWGVFKVDKSILGNPISIAAAHFEHGYGTHANSKIEISFKHPAHIFRGKCGVDDDAEGPGTIVCQVRSADKVLFVSSVVHKGEIPQGFSVPVDGINNLTLVVTDGGDGHDFDHADWVELKLE